VEPIKINPRSFRDKGTGVCPSKAPRGDGIGENKNARVAKIKFGNFSANTAEILAPFSLYS